MNKLLNLFIIFSTLFTFANSPCSSVANNKEFLPTLIKYYYYKGQDASSLAKFNNLTKQITQANIPKNINYAKDFFGTISSNYFIAHACIAAEYFDSRNVINECISAYIKTGLITNENEKKGVQETFEEIIGYINYIKDTYNISLTEQEIKVVAALYIDYLMLFAICYTTEDEDNYTFIQNSVSEFLIQKYANYYKNMPLPPISFIKSFELCDSIIKELQEQQ